MSGRLWLSLSVFLVVLLALLWRWEGGVRAEIDRVAQSLEAVASETAAGIDVAAHETIRTAQDSTSPQFLQIRSHLREVLERYGIQSPIYTLRFVDGGKATEFVVMTNPEPFVGDRYVVQDPMRPVLEQGSRARTALYGDSHGRWISGYAPLKTRDGTVVGLVEVDRPGEELHAELWKARVLALLFGLLSALLFALGDYMVRQEVGPFASLVRLLAGRLAVRVGLVGAVPVLLAVGVVWSIQVQEREEAAFARVRERLLHVVTVAAPRLDPTLHEAVVASGDPESEDFITLRDELRAIREGAQLKSAVYTLRPDGDRTAFVVMTNEVPFIGDTNELRPQLRGVLQDSRPAVDGPYTDVHSTWISAFAPISSADGSAVAAVLQADVEVSGLLTELRNRALRDLLSAFMGVLAAFGIGALLARRVALPIREIALASRRIERGDLDVRVSATRHDEVGQLGQAVNAMAAGLAEKEKLRDMFGKYMAPEVVRDLLEQDQLTLAGEEREITVVLTDIRGYTALSETLPAPEVVALLNEYFGILVDVVLESEGVIDKFMGDALLAWFGAPVAQEDHAARAVAVASGMLERTADWNRERLAAGLPAVSTGIGVASGSVVVGNIGSEKRFEYTAIGDAVNLASRLCSRAAAGEINATGKVRELSGDPRFESVGQIEVKGVREPVDLWRIAVPIVADEA